MHDVAEPPQSARLVPSAQRGESFPAEAALFEPLDLDVSKNPFHFRISTLYLYPATAEDSHLGFVISKYSSTPCILERASAAGIRNGRL
jgi:hypothetical protein